MKKYNKVSQEIIYLNINNTTETTECNNSVFSNNFSVFCGYEKKK